MKKIFVTLSINENGRRYAIAETIRTGENLLNYLKRYNLEVFHLCESRIQAEQLAIYWNECYKANGTNLY